MGVPYCIVKSKARLGTLVRRKTCSAICITDVSTAAIFFVNILNSQIELITLTIQYFKVNFFAHLILLYFLIG